MVNCDDCLKKVHCCVAEEIEDFLIGLRENYGVHEATLNISCDNAKLEEV